MINLIASRQFDQVISICKKGIHPDSEQDIYKVTPLVYLCARLEHFHNNQNIEQKTIELLDTLLRHGANPNHYGQNLGTAITVAIIRASTYLSGIYGVKIIKLLLDYQANVNGCPQTLHFAVSGTYPHPEIVKLLLQHGVCQTNKNGHNLKTGYTPLEYIKKCREAACVTNNPNLIAIQYMLENGWQKYDQREELNRLHLLKQQEEEKRLHLLKQQEEEKRLQLLKQQEQEKQRQLLKQQEQEKQRQLLKQQEEETQQQLLKQQEEEKRIQLLKEEEEKKIQLLKQEEETQQQLLKQQEEEKRLQLLKQEEEKQQQLLKQQEEENKIQILNQEKEKYELIMRINYMMYQMQQLANTVNILQNKCNEYEKNNDK